MSLEISGKSLVELGDLGRTSDVVNEIVMLLQVAVETSYRRERSRGAPFGETASLHFAKKSPETQPVDRAPRPAPIVPVAELGKRLEIAAVRFDRVG
jgi:hypothetical protein